MGPTAKKPADAEPEPSFTPQLNYNSLIIASQRSYKQPLHINVKKPSAA
jgi:hypothetical protein